MALELQLNGVLLALSQVHGCSIKLDGHLFQRKDSISTQEVKSWVCFLYQLFNVIKGCCVILKVFFFHVTHPPVFVYETCILKCRGP
jgi:hypothetical protein